MLKKGLTGFQVKIFALLFMTMDHIRYAFINVLNVPQIFSILGRIAAPLFVFMVTEGMRHTRSREKYLFRLWLGSVFMGAVNPLIDTRFPMASGGILTANIFSTLFIICLIIYGAEKVKKYYQEKHLGKVIGYGLLTLLPVISSVVILVLVAFANNNNILLLVKIVMLTVPSIFLTEGGFVFVALGIGFYLLGEDEIKTCTFYLVLSIIILILNSDSIQWLQVLALPFLLLYSGEKGKGMKYFFYLYYPLHLYILMAVSFYISR